MNRKLANTAVVAAAISAMLLAIKENTNLFAHNQVNNVVRERCYGIAKAGENACGNARHSCSGRATQNYLPDEWKMVTKGSCEKLGGHLEVGQESQG